MKLIRFGKIGEEKPGILLANKKKINVSGFGEDFNEEFFGTDGINRLALWLKKMKKFVQPLKIASA